MHKELVVLQMGFNHGTLSMLLAVSTLILANPILVWLKKLFSAWGQRKNQHVLL